MCIRVLLSRSFIASGTANYGSLKQEEERVSSVECPSPMQRGQIPVTFEGVFMS